MRLDAVPLNPDEIWSVWQTYGTPQQIVQWTPYDWPPLYYLLLGGWRAAAGAYPVVLRVLSASLFMLGVVFTYRLLRRWQGHTAGMLGMLAYAAFGFSIQLSLEVRGYALLLALMPLAWWLTTRYFDRPTWRRALPLAVVLAAMFYTSLTSFGAFALLGVFSLLVYPRRVIRWWLPGLLAGLLAAPEILNKAQIAVARVEATQTLALPPFHVALPQLFQDYTGLTWPLWVALFGTALIGLLSNQRWQHSAVRALAFCTLGVPILLYVLNPILGFYSPRYAWWLMPGAALLAGWGLAQVNRRAGLVAGLALAGILFSPLPQDGPYQIWDRLSPLGANFAWLRAEMQAGDALLTNPDNTCGAVEEWDYYTRIYFPAGLHWQDRLQGQRRVWVLNPENQSDTVRVALAQGYVPGRFVGPYGCLFRLYEAPPDAAGILFDNGLRFHGAEVIENGRPVGWTRAWHEGERVQVRLWWSADRPLPLDYSVGIRLMRGQTAFDQDDGPPNVIYPSDAPSETSRWQSETLYIEERQLTLPFPAAGVYELRLAVYFWQEPTPIRAPGVDENGHLRALTLPVKSY
jgi:hypothetical protein